MGRCQSRPPGRTRSRQRQAEDLLKVIPEYPAEGKAATRNSGGEILNHLAKAAPKLITGSADLFGSTKNYIKDGGDYSAANPKGRNIWFGIREHAMGAICNGIAYDGIFQASCATFLVFADYCRPSIRLAALGQTACHLHLHARQRRRR
jgi:transketolase